MTATFYVGDAIEVMSKLPEKSVDLVLTSPPFLALRSYLPADHPDKALEGGSQATPGLFIDWLIDVVEACDRVLAPHGSLCIELGDTYSGSTADGGDNRGNERYPAGRSFVVGQRSTKEGWPLAKSLSLIPELFRFTLVYGFNPLTGRQTERWRLRNVIRWVRPNPPVGALGDKFRPATSELMVFCKSAKRYFDLDAVRTEHQSLNTQKVHWTTDGNGREGNNSFDAERYTQANPAGAPPLDWWNIPLLEGEEPTKGGPKQRVTHPEPNPNPKRKAERDLGIGGNGWLAEGDYHQRGGAPPLDWWNIPPGGYQGSHYAVFPPELCVKPIKAMCPEKVCRVCGEPSRRIVGAPEYVNKNTGEPLIDFAGRFRTRAETNQTAIEKAGGGVPKRLAVTGHDTTATAHYPTLGFSDCGHDDWRPGLVLDPFGGSGTTALVATGHGRDCILIDLDARNFDLALERVGPFILSRAESV